MSAVAMGMQGLALALVGAAGAAALAAIAARSLFVMCMYLAAAGALAAAAMLVLGAGDGALGLALFAVAWAPVLLLAGMVLSARSAKPARPRRAWLSLFAALAVVGALVWPLTALAPAPAARGAGEAAGLGFWIAPLILAAAAACVGLLGYGERGALGRGRNE